MKENLKRALPDLAVILGFLVIAALYFITPISENLVLGGHDTVAGLGQGHEQQLYTQETGEYTRWTGSMFSGMPTYQIAPSYGPTDLLGKIGYALGLFTTGPLNYVFIYLLGFYLLMRVMRQGPAISALGASLWAFSSYFFIIIAAGHIWKVNTLGYIPPTIAGLILAYRGKYLWGFLVTALFTALQVRANHLQMTYYFLFVMAFIVIAYGVEAYRKHRALKAAPASADNAAPASASAPSAPSAPASAGVSTPSAASPSAPASAAPAPADNAAPTASPASAGVSTPSAASPAAPASAAPAALASFWRATLVVILGGIFGALVNLPSLYHTYQYTHESMRGPSELTAKPATASANASAAAPDAAAAKPNGGLDYDYITAWSYGVDETMTLMIPMYKGGGSFQNVYDDEHLMKTDAFKNFDDCNDKFAQMAYPNYNPDDVKAQAVPFSRMYWGAQPMTVGPVYVGAIACFLFFLGLFIVRGPLKWALAAATLLSFIFAWGYNIDPVTHFLVDHLPMYNKFRTVSSALVIAEFTIPLLAMLALAEVLRRPQLITQERSGRRAFIAALALAAGTCLIFALMPSIADVISKDETEFLTTLKKSGFPADFIADWRAAVVALRHDIISASAWRSFWIIVVGAAAIIAYAKKPKQIPAWAVVATIFVVQIADMWNINRNYLNDDNFQPETERTEGFAKTKADETILNTDQAAGRLSTRVINLTVNPFNENDNHTAYWHKSVGGYHAAKLHRYGDIIDHYLADEQNNIPKAINEAYDQILADTPHCDSIFNAVSQEVLANPTLTQGTNDINKTVNDITSQRIKEEAFANLDLSTATPLLNMLNTRWLILSPDLALENTSALGNAWIVDNLTYVDNPDKEIETLAHLDLRTQAVADKRFQQALGQPYDRTPKVSAPTASASAAPSASAPSAATASSASSAASASASSAPSASAPSDVPASSASAAPATLPAVNGGSVVLTSYAPNELHYTVDTPEESVVAFSEIYYPGWTATIDGKPTEVGRINYILRALRVPAGKHEVIFTFKPTSIRVTNTIAYTAITLLILGFIIAITQPYLQPYLRRRRRTKP